MERYTVTAKFRTDPTPVVPGSSLFAAQYTDIFNIEVKSALHVRPAVVKALHEKHPKAELINFTCERVNGGAE